MYLTLSTHFFKITLCYDKNWEIKLCISVNIYHRLPKLGMSTHFFKITLCYYKLNKANYMACFEALKGFFYVTLDENSKPFTAMLTPIRVFIAVYIDSYVTMSSDLCRTCRHCFYGTRFGYCSKGTKSSSDNIVLIFIHPII